MPKTNLACSLIRLGPSPPPSRYMADRRRSWSLRKSISPDGICQGSRRTDSARLNDHAAAQQTGSPRRAADVSAALRCAIASSCRITGLNIVSRSNRNGRSTAPLPSIRCAAFLIFGVWRNTRLGLYGDEAGLEEKFIQPVFESLGWGAGPVFVADEPSPFPTDLSHPGNAPRRGRWRQVQRGPIIRQRSRCP
jgi:hypothetical protein